MVNIYPIHLRKKRMNHSDSQSYAVSESIRLVQNIKLLEQQLADLKAHLNYMDNKYGPRAFYETELATADIKRVKKDEDS